MNKIKNNTKLLILVAFLTIFFSQFIFWGTSGLIAEERKNNIVVTPLSLTGTGTYLNPYLVDTNKDLNNLCDYTNSGGNTAGVYFKLTSSDLNADGAFVASLTEPIGTATYPFMGIFDGDNITLTGASFTTNANNQAGIFGQVKNATIQNLTVAYNSTNTTATTMGGIVASAYSSNIINCTNKTDIYNTTGDAMIAGIVGYAYNLNIENCTNQATIKCLSTGEGISSAGGIVGYGFNTDIKYCRVIPGKDIDRINGGGGGSSSSTSYRGGIAGNVYGGKTEESYNTSNIIASGTDSSYAGGIVGYASNHRITNCYNLGSVTASANEKSSSSTKLNDYSSLITKKTNAFAGGICGSGAPVSSCYNTGSVSGGKELYEITLSHTITSEVVSSVRGYVTAVTGRYNDVLSGKISVVAKYNYNNIMPSSSGSYTYSTQINNLYNDFSIKLSTNMNSSVLSGSSWRTSNTTGSFSLNLSDSNYLNKTYTGNTKGVATIKNKSYSIRGYTTSWAEFTSLSVVLKYTKSTLTLTHNYKQSTSSNYGSPNYSDKSASVVSVSLSREANSPSLVSVNEIKSSKFDGSDKKLPSGFSNSIWAFSSIINNGYPHLVKNYWQDSAKK